VTFGLSDFQDAGFLSEAGECPAVGAK
jgi:hypothetical protein